MIHANSRSRKYQPRTYFRQCYSNDRTAYTNILKPFREDGTFSITPGNYNWTYGKVYPPEIIVKRV